MTFSPETQGSYILPCFLFAATPYIFVSYCIGNRTCRFAEVSVTVTFHVTIFKLMPSLNLNISKVMLNSEIGMNPVKMIVNNFRKIDQAEI